MKKYNLKTFSVVIAAMLISCGGKKNQIPQDEAAPVTVTVETVKTVGSQSFVTGIGKVNATQSAGLGTRMMGFVDKINVKMGDQVKKGQVLVVINNADLQAKLARADAGIREAEAGFANAKKDYERFKNLVALNSASQKEMDDITTGFEMAKAKLASAIQAKNVVKSQFSYANISAPFDGVVTEKLAEAGDIANPGMTLITLESLKTFQAVVKVPESEISHIKSGDKALVIVKSINEEIAGKVVEVSASAARSGGQYLVKVALDDTLDELRSGMFATVNFPVNNETGDNTPLIANDALISYGQLRGVYTISQSNTAILRWLRLGRSHGDKIEVLAGLSPGERYVTSSQGKLYNGVKITIK